MALLLISTFFSLGRRVHAAYDGGNLIADSVFLNSISMSSSDIQNFLAAKNSGLAGRNFLLNCYGPTSQERQWYSSVGAPCDKEVPASQIIYYSAQVYGINPKVILATLQKEQSLITATNPIDWQINQAMGYACPTGGECNTASSFFYQIDNGTWALRYHYERARGNMSWWTTSSSWTCGSAKALYKPNLYPSQNVDFYDEDGILYRTLYISNAATSSLYCYTPHTYNNPQGLYGRQPYGTVGRYYSGSYNFVYWFEAWFGTTQGVPYAWNIESFTYSGGDNILAQNQPETMTLRARNIGTVPWYNHGNNPIRLGTWENADRYSQLFRSNRLATLQENVVLPGQVGTFIFTTTPTELGTFKESLNLVAENSQWAEWPGFRPTISVTSGYQWQVQDVIYEKGTGVMDPGTSQLITVKAKNTGTATWSKTSGPPVRLGTWLPDRKSSVGQGWISDTRAVTMNESSVAPGQVAGFQFYVQMPGSGQHYEQMNLVAEGQTWMNNTGLTLYLFGNNYSWTIDNISYSSGTGVMQVGTTQTITVKAKNTGTATWSKTSGPPVRLGTWLPDRKSSVGQGWISDTRAVTMNESSVAPGATATFSLQVKMPSTGIKYERMNLVAEGFRWFNDAGLTFYLEGK